MSPGERDVAGTPQSVDEVVAQLAALDIRHEELQVVSEELRAQQEQVTELLQQHEAELRWRSHLAAVVPLGLALTDGNGKLLEVNPALAQSVGVGFSRLLGKPLSVYLAPEDAPAFRKALRSLTGPPAAEQRLTVTLHPRGGTRRCAELFGFTEVSGPLPSAARVQWVLAPWDEARDQDATAGLPRTGPASPGPQESGAAAPADVVGLAASFVEMSALPVEEPDRQRLLSRMATLVRSAVPGADWVSITLGSPLEPQRVGSDSAEAQDFDGRQLRVQEGPCWQAYATGLEVVTGDVTTDERWPQLRALGGPTAVRSVLAIPISDGGQGAAVVNVYAGRRDAFGPANRRIGELAAAAVTGVLQNVAERESLRSLASNLETALTSRAVIDQAKGVLMHRIGVDADEAFARLVTLSSRLNVKLRDLARLVAEGDVELIIAAGG
ncbi:PAS domain S-box-containing protein [Geodermatophilus dictyosporus]|uniref:PAS domain S-box-containing protein n=1 Tax=Geodermatophilus dictyosporus TaxID=1523247 RepID=A0A1I5NHL3_9ACTN|nr:ANTAR domain-containing protein [Geodermatophilus dictyosporus]SFP21264.1 PAS domain S-box-containing protein [Geodermatophilus dictyosporus]